MKPTGRFQQFFCEFNTPPPSKKIAVGLFIATNIAPRHLKCWNERLFVQQRVIFVRNTRMWSFMYRLCRTALRKLSPYYVWPVTVSIRHRYSDTITGRDGWGLQHDLSGCTAADTNSSPHEPALLCTYAVGSKSFRPDIQKPRQMENAVRDI